MALSIVSRSTAASVLVVRFGFGESKFKVVDAGKESAELRLNKKEREKRKGVRGEI